MKQWKQFIEQNNIEGVKKMIESEDPRCDFWIAVDYARKSEMKQLLIPYCSPGQRVPVPIGSYSLGMPKLYGKTPEYAVVSWFNYRKEHVATCHALFENYEDAKEYAYKMAYPHYELHNSQNTILSYPEVTDEDFTIIKKILDKRKITSELSEEDRKTVEEMSKKYDTSFHIISEDEITDCNGPGESKYDSLVSFGNSKDGYSTKFYCVVEYFHGVENEWNFDYGFCPNVGSRWSPQYYWN